MEMDTSNNQTTNGTTTNTSSSGRPPSWVWVLVALASAITIGVLLFGLYQFIRRRRARRRDGDPEGATTDAASRGGGSTRGSYRPWNRRRRSRRHDHHSQPASRWGWVYPHTNRASTQSSEGLNELGEAPPPYNEDDLECPPDMAEVVHIPGEGPSRVASRQDRASLLGGGGAIGPALSAAHPEPPTYDFAMNLSTTSVQLPPPAVVVSPPQDS